VTDDISGELREGDEDEDDDDIRSERLPWVPAEVLATAILVTVGLLVLGGLATSIAAIVETKNLPFGVSVNQTGEFIELGSQWAGTLFSLLLFAVVGLCWWQVREWDKPEEAIEDEDLQEAQGRVRRAFKLVSYTQAGFILGIAGAIALLVGAVVESTESGGGLLAWSGDIYVGANALGATAMSSVGLWAVRYLLRGRSASRI
jgi:hypothetical protein